MGLKTSGSFKWTLTMRKAVSFKSIITSAEIGANCVYAKSILMAKLFRCVHITLIGI